ncbi:MAG: alpha-amylase family glycosyl hydrolase [Candidatus Saccharimonadales bacterium]
MSGRKLIYQIYPTAFGSLKEITARIPDIAKLGPDYIWLNPFFESPWNEGGYDVSDYRKVNPRFGTMQDFRKLVQVSRKYKIEILLDLVINHTSVKHEWFEKSRHRDVWYKDYYIWIDKPLNWQSFFGGTAYEYDQVRGQYYLHLFDKTQPDLNFQNPRVVREFQKIIDFWMDEGIAGFRVDSANVLSESKLASGRLPRIPGFFYYFQTKETVRTLEKLFGGKRIFSLAEPVGGDFLGKGKFHELTKSAFDASFNVGILDVADTVFSDKARPKPVNYRKWFKKLAKWTIEPKLSFALESHDTPRAVSRFNADPKALAMLQFLLPANYPCIYQGQEIGTKNPVLGNNIEDYPGVQSRAIYHQLIKEGKSKTEAMAVIKRVSRDNARAPLDFAEYDRQCKDDDSVLEFYRKLLELWRTDEVLIRGKLKVKRAKRNGIFIFERRYGDKVYTAHLDLTGKTKSTLSDKSGQILLSSR